MELLDPAKLAAQGRLVKAGRRSWALEPWVDWLTWNRNGGVRARLRGASAGGRGGSVTADEGGGVVE